jgi:triacylglycerol lipase
MNIVLAHGILGFDKIGSVAYFNGVEKHLKNNYQANVLVTKVSATGGIVERGDKLKAQILDGLGKYGQQPILNPDEDTHIIAHSMGGLDSRYILSPKNENNIAELITSLTTVGTPHRGSPIADFFHPLLDGAARFSMAAFLEDKMREFLLVLGISIDGLRDLTTQVMTAFDNDYVDSDEVRYFWTAGIGRPDSILHPKASALLYPTYEFIRLSGKTDDDRNNDGVVPFSSASHGEAIGQPWMADHLDEVGHDLNDLPEGTPKHFDYLEKYDEIMTRISSLKKTAKAG